MRRATDAILHLIRLAGSLTRADLLRLAEELEAIAADSMSVRIDWQEVGHVDYRGLPALARALDRLREHGGKVESVGFDAYLQAVASIALDREQIDLLAGENRAAFLRRARRPSLGDPAAASIIIPVSKN